MMMFVLIGANILKKQFLKGGGCLYTCAYRGLQSDVEYYKNTFEKIRVPTPIPFPTLEELTEIARTPKVLIALKLSVPKELELIPVDQKREAVIRTLYLTYTASRLPTVVELQEIYRLQELQIIEQNLFKRTDEIILKLLLQVYIAYVSTPPTIEQWSVERLTSLEERQELWRLKKVYKRTVPILRLGLHVLRALEKRTWPKLTLFEQEYVKWLYNESFPPYKLLGPCFTRQDLENLHDRRVIRNFEKIHGIKRGVSGRLNGTPREIFLYQRPPSDLAHPNFFTHSLLIHGAVIFVLYIVILMDDQLTADIEELAQIKFYSPRLEYLYYINRAAGVIAPLCLLSMLEDVISPVEEEGAFDFYD